MVSWHILGQHGLALLLIWAVVVFAGLALLAVLRLRVCWLTAPLLGVVYWTVSLYLFPCAGGLDLAGTLVCLLGLAGLMRVRGAGAEFLVPRRFSWSTAILLIGSLPYITTLLYHHVLFGMDGSMHATAAVLIARQGGLPTSYAPFTPELDFPPMNLGLPAVAALAIRWGGEPAAVMLACHHLTFTLLILATCRLLRRWIARTPAALLAVVSVWMARASQASLEWGGFPTVLSVAVGVYAAHLILEHGSRANLRLALTTGATVAAIPLIHGVGAGTWLYCVLPWITLGCLGRARNSFSTLRWLVCSGLVTLLLLIVYRSAGPIALHARDLECTHEWQQASTTLKDDWRAWPGALDFVRKDSGSFIVMLGIMACGVLIWRRRWLAFFHLGAAGIALTTVVANSRWWVLPASFLLYPERAIYWTAPGCAVALALAWRALPYSLRATKPLTFAMAVSLLVLGGYFHNQFYQKIVRTDFVNQDGYEALLWARQHLDARTHFVQAPYNSTGSFLPALAQIGCTGAHHHHFIAREVDRAYQQRVVTHVLVDQAMQPTTMIPEGKQVFHNRTITILELPQHPR